ncbi:MAG: hypothetical protein R3208_17835 [Ketobacteraceae bacterium]|nr:hypothetical protein [Ketobacteraceae bacterium]
MSTGLLAVSVVIGIVLIMGLFYISHTIEKQRARRALMIGNLSERAMRLQRLIEVVPPAYLPRDLKLVMLNQIKTRYEKLVELAPSMPKFKKHLDTVLVQISDTQNSTEKPAAPRFKTPQEAAEIKSALQALSKTVEAFVQKGHIPPAKGQQHLNDIQRAFIEANVNYLIGQGDLARKEQKAKLAAHYYQKAVAELGKRNNDKRYSERIAQLKGLIAQLSDQPEAQRSSEGKSESELDKGIENLIEEDNAWKKKYF